MKTMLSLATAPPSGQNSNQKAKYPKAKLRSKISLPPKYLHKNPCEKIPAEKITAKTKYLQTKTPEKIDTCGKQSFRVCKMVSDSLFDRD